MFRPLESNPVASIALPLYVFLFATVTGELLAVHGGIRFPLIAICFVGIVILYLVSGHPLQFARTPFFLPWCALLCWWLLAGITGIYKGRSMPYLFEYGIRVHTLPLIFCGIALDIRGIRRLLYGCGFALLGLLAACFKWGTMSEDRFIIPDTSLGNANDLGLRLLLFGSLFLIFFLGGMRGRLLGCLTLPMFTYYVLKTGSRANLVTIVVIMVMSLFMLPGAKKALPIVAILGFCFAAPFLPQQTLNRLRAFFYVPTGMQTDRATELAQTAVDSTNARMNLQRRAIELTMEHPLLGVGPLNFEDAVENMVRKAEGHRSGWQVSHNSYLQVSAESGLPGVFLFTCVIGMCVVTNYRSFRRLQGEAAMIAFIILLTSVVYAVGILFCSVAYDFQLSLLVGLTAASSLAFQQQWIRPPMAQLARR
jgi:O-antigen ligase